MKIWFYELGFTEGRIMFEFWMFFIELDNWY